MGDPASGNTSVVVVDFEQSWGVAKGSPKGRKVSIIENTILPNRGLIANPSLRASFNPAKPFPGSPKPAGTIQLVPNLQVTPFIQKLITGTLVKSGATAASGTIVCVPKADLIDGETVTIDDGTNTPTVFEFDVNGTGVAGSNVQVNVSSDTTAIQVAARLHAAINGVGGTLTVTSTNPGTGTLNLVNDAPGATGNETITDTVADTDFVVTGMAGGAPLPYVATSKLGATMPASAIVEGSLNIGGTMKYARATGVRVNNWSIPIAHEGPLILNLGVKAKNVTYEDTAYDSSLDDWTTDDPIDQAFLVSGSIKVGGVVKGYVKSGTLTGDAMLQDDLRAGLVGNGSLVPKTHAIGGNLEIVLESIEALTLVTGGAVTDLEFVWQVTTGRSWGVTYHVVLEPTGPPIKDGLITIPVTFQGFEDSGTGTAVTFVSTIGVDPDTEYA